MAVLKFIYGTEAQILALKPVSTNWVDRAFYYPEDQGYFFQARDGVMKKYGAGESSGVGVRINGDLIGGVKSLIEAAETLTIPENYDYNIHTLNVQGAVDNQGQINLI